MAGILSNVVLSCLLLKFREEFKTMLSNFAVISQSPNWTFVFNSLSACAMIECGSVAMERGYKVEVYVWNKPDLCGKSHGGGPRQATSSEYIVVVYKHEDPSMTSLAAHFSLLHQKEKLVWFFQIDFYSR